MTYIRSKARYDRSPLLDPSLFIRWCRETNSRLLQGDEEYRLKIHQRNIRYQNKENLSKLQQEYEEALSEWKNHSSYARVQSLQRDIEGKEKAINNMEKFLHIDPSTIEKDNEREKVLRTQKAHEICQGELHRLREDFSALQAIPEYQQTILCHDALQSFVSSIGLDKIKEAISSTQKDRGGKRSERGRSFEDKSEDAVQTHLIAYLKHKFSLSAEEEENLIIVRNITFGIASYGGSPGEFDILVCLRTSLWDHRNSSEKNSKSERLFNCCVLAIVEAKRNPDDIGTAFSGLQPTLAWLCGKREEYDPINWMNKNYPTGHFDRSVVFLSDLIPHPSPYLHPTQSLVFTSESFSRISSISSSAISNPFLSQQLALGICYAEDLYFITRDGWYDNLTSKSSNVIIHRLASDLEFDDELSDENALNNLRVALLSHSPKELTTSDALDVFESLRLPFQIVVIGTS